MVEVSFIEDEKERGGIKLQYAVIAARSGGKWVFCRHKERQSYEMPGGHIEPGESAFDAARRELYEETGAEEFSLRPVSVYSVERGGATSFGELFLADISRLGPLPADMEMAELVCSDRMPFPPTYPDIQPLLLGRAKLALAEELSVRKAEKRDADAVVRVFIDAWRDAYRGILTEEELERTTGRESAEAFRRRLDESGCEGYVVAERRGRIEGVVAAGRARESEKEGWGEIIALYSHPESFGSGVGQSLMLYALAALKIDGYAGALLWTFRDNKRARRFYEKMGFEADGAEKPSGFGRAAEVRYVRTIAGAEKHG